ncbi:DUF58 domain-containing protein [Cetobacterium sp. SF1]|uniref:DUF58 domain-containing protein n=1 Tax=Cetobacterium sp. SF1 TaxID=3417654 RepID=UPI003CF6A402
MEKKDILKKIKKIEIKSTILSNTIFAGEYHSCLKGNGMEFSDIRRYSQGDDVKKIDWKVTAKQGKAYIKEFVEERELPVFLLVDMSYSDRFEDKKNLISELVATLAFSANKNGDRVGALFFTEKVEKAIPLKKGKKHILSIIENLLLYNPKYKGTNIKEALRYFGKIFKKRGIIFIISDFLDNDFEKEIKILKNRHEIIPIQILDKKYDAIPKGAIFSLEDSETGEEIIVETLKNELSLQSLQLKGSIKIDINDDYVKALTNYFRKGKKI